MRNWCRTSLLVEMNFLYIQHEYERSTGLLFTIPSSVNIVLLFFFLHIRDHSCHTDDRYALSANAVLRWSQKLEATTTENRNNSSIDGKKVMKRIDFVCSRDSNRRFIAVFDNEVALACACAPWTWFRSHKNAYYVVYVYVYQCHNVTWAQH